VGKIRHSQLFFVFKRKAIVTFWIKQNAVSLKKKHLNPLFFSDPFWKLTTIMLDCLPAIPPQVL
jgi:hypothetical protein